MESNDVDPWRKSTYSSNGGGNCVEVGQRDGSIMVRDTKDAGQGPVIKISPAEFRSLVARVMMGL